MLPRPLAGLGGGEEDKEGGEFGKEGREREGKGRRRGKTESEREEESGKGREGPDQVSREIDAPEWHIRIL